MDKEKEIVSFSRLLPYIIQVSRYEDIGARCIGRTERSGQGVFNVSEKFSKCNHI